VTARRGDREDERLLAQLQGTPVGRRWLLKAGLGSAAAAAAASLGPVAAARAAPEAPEAAAAAGSARLQFALDVPGIAGLMLVANGIEVPLRPHTAASRSALRAAGGLWKVMDLGVLSHYVPAAAVPAMPSSRGMLVSVQGRRGRLNVLANEVWHVPAAATLALAQASQRLLGSLEAVVDDSPRLAMLGLTLADFTAAAEVVQLDLVGDAYQSATALTMSHPQVATIDPMMAATTKAVLGDSPPVQALGTYIRTMQRAGRDFATLEEAVDDDGSPSVIKIGDTETTFSVIMLNDTDARFTAAAAASVSGGIAAVRDTAVLGAVTGQPLDEEPAASTATWVQPQGIVPRAQPAAQAAAAAAAGVSVKVKNPGFLSGTYTRAGSLSGTKVPVTVYNNYVRWIWVYVQYLGPGGVNLSIDPKASFPDTKYSRFAGVLPQVFTVFGVPLWDTNTLGITLDFPAGALSARLLYCSLGADLVGGGWRQYFPPGAYSGKIAPEDEVLYPALATGILSIGMNAFALACDIQLARTWGVIKEEFGSLTRGNFGRYAEAWEPLTRGSLKLTVAEALATAVCGGSALYATLGQFRVSAANLWGLLLRMASVVPKLIFSIKTADAWQLVDDALRGDQSAQRLARAIPVVGQVLAIASLVGDAATLAQAAAGFFECPWVIANEVSRTYEATVTISRDPRSGTFPVTARSWRLEANVDGATVLYPVTGTVNPGGVAQSDPVVVPVKGVPFGGAQICWSVAFLDEAGQQVGTGVSAAYPNNDPARVPDAVGFAITQLPATISASTVFKRAVTTAWSPAAGGYVWSPGVTVAATLASPGAVDVISTSVATLAGVAGVVWREGDRYYLRGVPVAQNGATVELGTATREGYARRPFLLLDSFVEASSEGNHVLLEPDETTSGYVIRKVSLNAVTGALSWNPGVSAGMFTLPVSAAALHSSGRVVAVSTEAGRLGWLQPVDLSGRPQLAAYTAGPGTEVGLLSSPVALAVTNPGTVLVLEAAAQQLSAFDLNGNPAPYFTAAPSPGYVLPLVSDGTYLDVAVDGAEQVYLLYFTGTGTAPADYRVDVYNRDGSPLATRSPGVNVPHLAVDYWRSLFAAHDAPLARLGTTTPRISPALGVPEPSVSRFDPTTGP